jgi:hypothetical protein
MRMRKVGLKVLKNKLSEYVRLARPARPSSSPIAAAP